MNSQIHYTTRGVIKETLPCHTILCVLGALDV